MLSTGRLLVRLMKLCKDSSRWTQMNDMMAVMAKKRGQLKQAIVKMIDEAMTYLDATPNKDTKIALIQSIRTVTEGKVLLLLSLYSLRLYTDQKKKKRFLLNCNEPV
jgi:26S proteasome regulatory subunit N5